MSKLQKPNFSLGFERFSGIYIALLFVVVFGFLRPDIFLTANTMYSIASQQAVIAILGIALLIPLAAGAFDLSIGANVGLSAILVTVLQKQFGWGPAEAIAVTLCLGLLIGFINGFLVVQLQVSSFIATLGVGSIVSAVQVIVTDNRQPLPELGPLWLALTQSKLLGFQMIFWYLVILSFIVWWLMSWTPFGRYIQAIGGNPEAARLSGVPVGRYTWMSFVICGLITSFGGIGYASLNGPSLTFGNALLLPAYAAAFLGFTQIHPGRFNVWGTFLAVYVLAIGIRGLQYMTSVQWLNFMFNGIAVIAAVAFAGWRQRVQLRQEPPEPVETMVPVEAKTAS